VSNSTGIFPQGQSDRSAKLIINLQSVAGNVRNFLPHIFMGLFLKCMLAAQVPFLRATRQLTVAVMTSTVQKMTSRVIGYIDLLHFPTPAVQN
jgi:hypothetical protein